MKWKYIIQLTNSDPRWWFNKLAHAFLSWASAAAGEPSSPWNDDNDNDIVNRPFGQDQSRLLS